MKNFVRIILVSMLSLMAVAANAVPGVWKPAQPSFSPLSGLEYTITGRICDKRPAANCITTIQLQALANTHSHPSPIFMTVGNACPTLGQWVYSWTYGAEIGVGFKQKYWAQVCGL